MHLVDTTMFFASEGGGVGRYLAAKHAWLAAHSGIEHTIVVPGERNTAEPGGRVRVASPALPGLHGYRFPMRIASWSQALIELQPDIIEVGDPYVPAWAAVRAARTLGIPVVAFYHSDLVRLVGARTGSWSEPVVARYVAKLYRHFDLVIAPSRYVYEKLRRLGIRRVTCRPLGVDVTLFHPDKRDPKLRSELGLPQQARLLIFAGRFAREKNLGILLEAFRMLGAPYHLLLVGAGMKLPSQENATVLPYQSNGERLARLMASCDALVHAGDQETFGLIALEAMACARPVIATNSGGLTEIVHADTGILAKPRNSAALASAVRALYDSDIETLGQQARAYVESNFSWDTVMGSLAACYTELAQGSADLAPTYATH